MAEFDKITGAAHIFSLKQFHHSSRTSWYGILCEDLPPQCNSKYWVRDKGQFVTHESCRNQGKYTFILLQICVDCNCIRGYHSFWLPILGLSYPWLEIKDSWTCIYKSHRIKSNFISGISLSLSSLYEELSAMISCDYELSMFWKFDELLY